MGIPGVVHFLDYGPYGFFIGGRLGKADTTDQQQGEH
jgi:hypothetical protein